MGRSRTRFAALTRVRLLPTLQKENLAGARNSLRKHVFCLDFGVHLIVSPPDDGREFWDAIDICGDRPGKQLLTILILKIIPAKTVFGKNPDIADKTGIITERDREPVKEVTWDFWAMFLAPVFNDPVLKGSLNQLHKDPNFRKLAKDEF